MPIYSWRHIESGEILEVFKAMKHSHVPPDASGKWERIFSFGVGSVEGGGGTPARPSPKEKS